MASCAGVGGLRPRTVAVTLPKKDARAEAQPRTSEFVQSVQRQKQEGKYEEIEDHYNTALAIGGDSGYFELFRRISALEMNIMLVSAIPKIASLLRRKSRHTEGNDEVPATIDVWVVGEVNLNDPRSSTGLLLQYGWLLLQSVRKDAPDTELRILQIISETQAKSSATIEAFGVALSEVASDARIVAPRISVLGSTVTNGGPIEATDQCGPLGDFIAGHSSNTLAAILALPEPTINSDAAE